MSYNDNIIELSFVKPDFVKKWELDNDDDLYTYNDELRHKRRKVDDRKKHHYVPNGAFKFPYREDINPTTIFDKSTLMTNIKIHFEDGTDKYIRITYGTKIYRLKYYDNGELKETKGTVKNLLFRHPDDIKLLTPKQPTLEGKNPYILDLSELEFIGFTLDCSTEENSNVITVYKHNIRDIDTKEFPYMRVSDVKFVDLSTVTFKSNIKPRVAIWNNMIVEINEKDIKEHEFEIKIDTILPNNILELYSPTNNIKIDKLEFNEQTIE